MARPNVDVVGPRRANPDNAIKDRKWMFTIFEDLDVSWERLRAKTDARYLLVGRETCPTTGRQHLQGVVVFHSVKTRRQLQDWTGAAHWCDPVRSSVQACSIYCAKDGTYHEFGTIPAERQAAGQREHSRYDIAFDLARAGKFEQVEKDLLVRHFPNFIRINTHFAPEPGPLNDVCGIWVQGPSGCGKSSYARLVLGATYDKDMDHWWDGFDQSKHDVVLIDDLCPMSVEAIGKHLKRWMDEAPFNASFKGFKRVIRPKLVIVTSQYTIQEVFTEASKFVTERDGVAIARRCQRRNAVAGQPPISMVLDFFNPIKRAEYRAETAIKLHEKETAREARLLDLAAMQVDVPADEVQAEPTELDDVDLFAFDT